MKKILTILFAISFTHLNAQDTLTIDSLTSEILRVYPESQQIKMNSEISLLQINRLQTNYLPSIDFSAKATYQSDVPGIDVNIPIPGFTIPSAPHEQYGLNVDVKQILYDGGVIKNLKNNENSNLEIKNKLVEIDLYKLRETIDNLYFTILILQKSEQILLITKNDLISKQKNIESGVKNGVLTSDNTDKLDAEILSLDEKIIESQENKKSAFAILYNLSKIKINENLIFVSPKINVINTLNMVINRPENEYFTLQSKFEEANINLLNAKRLPTIAAFGQFGYGNPGLNVLQNKWAPYYIVGLKLNWNIFDWNNTQKDKKILKIHTDIIGNSQETFNTNISTAAEKEKSNIEKYRKMIDKDNEIIVLRQKILEKSASQLENGTITISDYLQNSNELSKARIESEINKIQLLLSQRNYERIMGVKTKI
jgi:outer membrane protein TolC